MKNLRKLASLITCGALALSLAACTPNKGAAPSATPTPTAQAKTYTATGTGYGGDVMVTLSVVGTAIQSITAEGAGETAGIGGAAIATFNEKFAAMTDADLSTLTADAVDAVAGATVTSNAVKGALKNVLNQANGIAVDEKAPVADATATYQAVGNSVATPVSVEVSLKDGKIAAITVGENGETPSILKTVTDRLIPRILESQSLAVDAISGATVSSNAVKDAVAQAINANGGDAAQWYAPVEKKTDTVKMEGYDVIVVGLGGSGMTSYISAAEKGATVFGFDTAGKIGGTSTNVSGPMAINPATKMAEQNGGAKFLEEEDLIADWLEYCRGDAKEDIVREFVNESGETMDWLINDYGFAFAEIKAFFHPKMWPVWATYQGEKTDMFTSAVEKAKALNEKNDYMLELTATDLLTEGDKITGVKATSWDGTTYEIYGDSVILATGGFLGNGAMTEEYLGGTFNAEAMLQNDGAGVSMALRQGAGTYNVDMPGMVHIAQTKTIIKSDELTADQKAVLSALVLTPESMIVGADGARFMSESSNIAFDNWKGGDTCAAKDYSAYADGSATDPFGKDTALMSSLAEGPYYAVAGAGYYYGTCGGLDIDASCRVLKTDGTAFENLFAVGQESMGVLFSNQVPYVTYGGAAQGWVLTSGRLAGANAAEAYAK